MVGRLRLSLAWALLQELSSNKGSNCSDGLSTSASEGAQLSITGLVVGSGLAAEPLALHILVRLALLGGEMGAALAQRFDSIDVCGIRAGKSVDNTGRSPTDDPDALFSLVVLTCRIVAAHMSWDRESIVLYSKASKTFDDADHVGALRVD